MSALNTFAFQVREGVGLAWQLMAGAGAILVGTTVVLRRRGAAAIPSWRDGLTALAIPWTLPIWATLTAGVEKGGRAAIPWASIVLGGLALLALSFSIFVLYRGRRYWFLFLPIVITVAIACFLGVFVGVMQIVDDWV